MPLVIPNTTTTAKFEDAKFAGNDVLASGFFTIANNGVNVILYHGIFGQTQAGNVVFLPPGTYPVSAGSKDPISGIAFQSAVAGKPAQVFGVLYYPGESSILSGNQFNSFVSPSGVISIINIPTGTILPFAGAVAPSGTVFCDGSHYDGTTAQFQSLWGIIGLTYGGTTQADFAVPDLIGRIPVGKGTNVSVNALNKNDGVAAANRRPQHRHTPHSHTITAQTTSSHNAGGGVAVSGDDALPGQPVSSVDGGSGISTDSLDSPAFIVVNYVISL